MKGVVDNSHQRTLPASLGDDDRSDIALAVRYLTEQGAKKVLLFGSLAKGVTISRHSDFDFAVEGLPGDRLFSSVGHLLQVLSRTVDIINLESCPSVLRAQILEHGILLSDEG